MTAPTPEDLQQLVDISATLYSLGEQRQMIELQIRMLRQKIEGNLQGVNVVLHPLMEALDRYDYHPRGTSTLGDGIPRYAVHPEWASMYDLGYYNTDTQTWDASLGDVPNWALLHIQP